MLFLEDEDAGSAEVYVKKGAPFAASLTSAAAEARRAAAASSSSSHNFDEVAATADLGLELQYRSCAARVLDARRDFTRAAAAYATLSRARDGALGGGARAPPVRRREECFFVWFFLFLQRSRREVSSMAKKTHFLFLLSLSFFCLSFSLNLPPGARLRRRPRRRALRRRHLRRARPPRARPHPHSGGPRPRRARGAAAAVERARGRALAAPADARRREGARRGPDDAAPPRRRRRRRDGSGTRAPRAQSVGGGAGVQRADARGARGAAGALWQGFGRGETREAKVRGGGSCEFVWREREKKKETFRRKQKRKRKKTHKFSKLKIAQ